MTERRWIAGVEPAPELLGLDGTRMLEVECREQPARLRALLDAYRTDAEVREQMRAMKLAAAERTGPVLFLGMGGSLCSAISGVAQLQLHGRAAFAVDAGEWLHVGVQTWKDAAFSVLLTTSGESAELVELLRTGDRERMGLLSNNPASKGWALAARRLPILAGPEYGNATKTYTNSTAAAIVLASEMVGQAWVEDGERALEVFSAALERIFTQRAELDAFCAGAANVELIGRGAGFGAAVMGALTIREMSGLRAAPHTGAGFRHGPNLDVDASHVAVILALGPAPELGVKLAEECVRRGGKVVLVSSEERPRTERLLPIQIDAVAESWEGLTGILVPQALTLALIERVGCRLPPRFEYGVMEQ